MALNALVPLSLAMGAAGASSTACYLKLDSTSVGPREGTLEGPSPTLAGQ